MSADEDEKRWNEEEAPSGTRHVIVVGGGRAGVGKSLVATNLAVYFAQLGKSVVLVDADPAGSNLHAHFGLRAATREPPLEEGTSVELLRASLVETNVPGLSLLPAAHDALSPTLAHRGLRKSRLIARLRTLPSDFLVIDVGPGHAGHSVDLMLAADVALAVTVPEPPAVETTYRFLRAAYRRRLRRAVGADKFRRNLVERASRELGVLGAPVALVRALAKMDRSVAELAWDEAQRLRVHLVVNQTRVRSDLELGSWMSQLAAQHYGVKLDELGHIEHDDTVWATVRRGRPLLVDSPTCKAARNLERIARRLLALTTTRLPRGGDLPPLPLDEGTHYEALGLSRAATDEEIRRAYKRQKEIYATGGVATASLFTEEELRRAQARLDEVYDTLLDLVRRRAYDLSTFSDVEPHAPPRERVPPALAAEQLMLQAELSREIGPDTEFTGELLRKVRESQGVELLDIGGVTKISRSHLAAIEAEDFATLPAPVYVRGFLGELAKYLRLDVAAVQRTYLRRMRDAPAGSKERA